MRVTTTIELNVVLQRDRWWLFGCIAIFGSKRKGDNLTTTTTTTKFVVVSMKEKK